MWRRKLRALTNDEFAAELSGICREMTARLGLVDDARISSFRANGDRLLGSWRESVRRLEALTPPDELRSAASRFDRSAAAFLGDLRDLTAAAKAGDQSRFEAALGNAAQGARAAALSGHLLTALLRTDIADGPCVGDPLGWIPTSTGRP